MKAEGIDDQAMADRLNCTRTHVTKLRNGQADPSMALARAIESASGGLVTLADWPAPLRGSAEQASAS